MYTDDISSMPLLVREYLNYAENIQGKSFKTVNEYFYDLRTFFIYMKKYKSGGNIKDLPGSESIKQNKSGNEKGIPDSGSIKQNKSGNEKGMPDSKNMNQLNSDAKEDDISGIGIEFIESITLNDLYSYMSYLGRTRKNSPGSRARKTASIRSFFKYLHTKAKLLSINPAAELESPKLVKKLPRYLDVDESKKLLSSVEGENEKRDYAILTLFLNCGLRLSELTGINIMDLRNDTLVVLGKGNKERTIYLNKACRDAIDEYLKVRPKDRLKDKEALFISEKKNRICNNMVYRIVRKYIQASGLDPRKYSTHKLRHTAATLLYKHGKVDIRTLQAILGHESIATTEIYTHLDSQQVREAMTSNPLANEKGK